MEGIVSTTWMVEHLNDQDLRIIDARGSFATYEEGHIPGAQMLHIETLRMSDGGIPCKMFSPDVLATIFGRLGITNSTPVIIYATDPKDHVSASYTAWSLAVSGNTNVRILDGGFALWEDNELTITQQFPEIMREQYSPGFNEPIFADWQYINSRLGDPDVVLVDTRTRSMYTGLTGPTQRRGHIPGAVLHNYIWDFQRDGTYLPEKKLRERYEREGITPDKEIITYCVTGREGSAAWFILKVMLGYPRVRLYQASMTEWTAHPELPVVQGLTPMGTSKAA
ncbi:MAG TPA: sulfurtransferase [Armatimonadota bacterium]|nr:sulfurtransferase [Armatimonadota bacterium]